MDFSLGFDVNATLNAFKPLPDEDKNKSTLLHDDFQTL